MSIIFLTENGMYMDGKLVEQEARMEIWPWYKVLWNAFRRPYIRYVVCFKPKQPTEISDAK